MRNIIYSIFIIVVFLNLSFSQERWNNGWLKGHVIMKSGDTLRGIMYMPVKSSQIQLLNKLSSKGKKILQFKKDNYDDSTLEINSEHIDRIRLKKTDFFVTHKYVLVGKQKTLLKLEIEDELSLFSEVVVVQNQFHHRTTKRYYVQRKDEKGVTLLTSNFNKGFVKKAKKYFSGCSSLVSKLEDKTFKQKNIKAIVQFYNKNCN